MTHINKLMKWHMLYFKVRHINQVQQLFLSWLWRNLGTKIKIKKNTQWLFVSLYI